MKAGRSPPSRDCALCGQKHWVHECPNLSKERKTLQKGKAADSTTPGVPKECPFCGKKGHTEDNCWKKHPNKAPDRRVKDEVHYHEKTPPSPKREVKEEGYHRHRHRV